MKKLVLLLMAGGVFASMCTMKSRGEQPDALKLFMQDKLKHSQKLLEGLTQEDYAALAKNSQELALLSQATNWNVINTEDYLQHSIEFRRSANALTRAAKAENLDGATWRLSI